MLNSTLQQLINFFTLERLQRIILVVLIAAVGFILLKILSSLVDRMTRKVLSQQYNMLVRKAIQYLGAVILLFIVLSLLGVNINALLGAAGIVGIAVGFASQTSMSNLISGLFLISEKPFEIGDVIKVGEHSGVILSIDLLSLKIKTFDNQYIRIPNSLLLSTELTNVTRFPIRRLDIKLMVGYRTNINRLKQVLLEIAGSNPYCLDEPEPLIVFAEFRESGIEFLFGVWFYRDHYLDLKNSIMQQIKERFEAEGIEFPFPHRTLVAGAATPPLPVKQAADRPQAKARAARKRKAGSA
jgi:small-conductance mechanosensitive channel